MPDDGDPHGAKSHRSGRHDLARSHTARRRFTDDGRRGDPAVRDVLRRAQLRGARAPAAQARPRPGRRRVPGDVPPGAAGLRPARARRAPARLGADDRLARRDRRPPAHEADGRGARARRTRTRAPPTRISASSPTACRRRSGRPSCSATATTSPTTRSRRRSTRARRRPARPPRPACAGCRKEHDHDRSRPISTAASARRPPAAACSTPATTSSTARSGRCSSPPPTAASCASRSTRTSSSTSSGSPGSPAAACCARRGRSTRVRRELDEYFEGRRHAFDLAVDLRGVTPFTERVLQELARDPVRRDGDLRRARRAGGQPEGRARGRHDDEPQPRSRSCSPATASSARTAASSATPAGSSARWRCSRSRACSSDGGRGGTTAASAAARNASAGDRQTTTPWNASTPASRTAPAARVERRVARPAVGGRRAHRRERRSPRPRGCRRPEPPSG